MSDNTTLPSILADGDVYDEVAAQPKDERLFAVAKSLVAGGMTLIPCFPYDATKYENARAKFLEVGKNGLTVEEKEHLNKASGKCPAKRNPYGFKKSKDGNEEPVDSLCQTVERAFEWFNPKNGKYRGMNLGLVTGKASGIVVVDIDDSDPEKNGWDAINELTAKHGQINTIKVRSGGKSKSGQHWYFKYRDDLKTVTSKLTGVDIRSNKGHVMAPMCECQGTYEVLTFGELAEMPDWLVEALMGHREQHEPSEHRQAVDRPDAPLDLIESALSYLPVDMFDGVGLWLKIAMCIHSEHPDDGGFDLLDRWSRGDLHDGEPDGYDRAGNELRWKSFSDQENNLTIGTLFHAAACGELDGYQVGGGWIDPRKGQDTTGPGSATMMMNSSFVIVNPSAYRERMRREKKYDLGPAPVTRVPKGTIYTTGVPLCRRNWKYEGIRDAPEEVSPQQVADETAHFRVEIGEDAKGNKKFKSLYQWWREAQGKRYVRGVGYYVQDKNVPMGVLNLFTGWGVTPKPGNPAMFLKHLHEIICDGDDEKYGWLINRLAYVVQMGEENLPSALVVNGAEGLGKGIIWRYLELMVGPVHSYRTGDPETFTTRFIGEELAGKFIVCVDEALFSGDVKADNKMKGLVGNASMRDEGKGKAVKQSQNVTFFMFFSNHDDPVQMTRGNRRFTIMTGNDKFSESKRKADPEVDKAALSHFKALAAERDGDGPANLLHMLLNHDVDIDFATKSLMTREKVEMAERQEAKRDSLTEWMIYLLENEPLDEGTRWGTWVQASKLYEEYNQWVKDNKHNHPSRGWVAMDVSSFKKAMTGVEPEKHDYGFLAQRKAQGNGYQWPTRPELADLLHTKFPSLVEREYDANNETEF